MSSFRGVQHSLSLIFAFPFALLLYAGWFGLMFLLYLWWKVQDRCSSRITIAHEPGEVGRFRVIHGGKVYYFDTKDHPQAVRAVTRKPPPFPFD